MTTTAKAEDGMEKTKQALIIVDPGFRSFSLRIGEIIGGQLTQQGYKVELVLARRFQPRENKGVDLLVLGGPIYAGRPGRELEKAIGMLENVDGLKTLLYVTKSLPQDEWEPLELLVAKKGLAVIGKGKFLLRTRGEAEVTKQVRQLLEALND